MSKPFFQRAGALFIAILFLATSLGFTGLVIWEMSKKDDPSSAQSTQEALNEQLNQEDVIQSQGKKLEGYNPVAPVNELQIIDLEVGSGETVKPGATVTAHYTVAYAKDGTIFGSSYDTGEPGNFPLGTVLPGWQKGVPGMKVGGTRRLIIPASLAYGEAGSPPAIGPNEPLVFDIKLISVEPS